MVYLTPSFMVLLAAVFSLPEGANTAALPAGRRSSMVEMDGRDVNPSFKPFQGNIAPGQHNVAFPVAKPLIDSRSAAIQLQSTGSSSSSSSSSVDDSSSSDSGPKSQSFKSRPSSSDDDEMDMEIGDSSVSADVDPGMDWVVGDSNDANSFAAQADSDSMADDMVDTPTQTSVGNQFAPRPRPVDPDAQDNAQASAWRALPCNGQMVEGVKNTGDEQANNYRYLAQPNNLAAATPTATYDDGMYHPHPATRTPGPGDGDSNPNVARSIYHSHKGDKKSSKKEPVVEGKDRFHVKGSKSFLKESEKKGEKEGKHPHKAHGSKGSKKEILSGRDVVDIDARSLQVLGANVAMSLAGGDTALIGNSKPDGKGNLVKLNARHSDHYDHHHHDDEHYHGHEHDHDHEHVHEHIHEHNHKRLLPGGSSGTGLAGTVGVLQPLSSLLPSGLAQQVASLVLSPLSSLTAGKSLMDTAGAANQFLLSPSTTEHGTKLILVEDPISTAMGSGDVQSNGTATNAQWKHVSLQTTIFDLSSGTGANKVLCATIDRAPPSTLRMAECRPAGTDPTTSQEFLYDPVSGEIQPSMASTPAVAARDAPSSAPTSVKLVFLVDDASATSSSTDSPPLLPQPQSMLATSSSDDDSSSVNGSSFKASADSSDNDSYGSVEDAEFTPAMTTSSSSWRRTMMNLFTRSSSKGKGHNGNKITVGNKNLNNNGRKQKHQSHKVHKNNKAFLRRDA